MAGRQPSAAPATPSAPSASAPAVASKPLRPRCGSAAVRGTSSHRRCCRGRPSRRCRQRVERRTHHLGREGRVPEAHAGGVEDGVGDGRGARHRRRLARTQRRLAGARHQQHVHHRHVAEVQDRVAAPFPGADAACLADRRAHALLESPAGGLQHVAMHLLLHAQRVDHQAGVVAHHHAAHRHVTGLAVDLHVGHPGRPGGAEAGEPAVHVACVGKALALEPISIGCPAAAVACAASSRPSRPPRAPVRPPARPSGGAAGRPPGRRRRRWASSSM